MTKVQTKKRKIIKNILKWTSIVVAGQVVLSKKLLSKSKPRVVVIGSGFGGGTVINYLSNFTDIIELVVIDKNKTIQTCPFSNLVIGDVMSKSDITFNVKSRPNILFNNLEVNYIDSSKKKIIFTNKDIINYDYIILSPGIGFKSAQIDGFNIKDNSNVPHCWDGEKNIIEFKNRLNSLENNSKIIITSPDYPYRCPPAPYERASMIAYFLKKKGLKFKIFILDSKNSFTKKEVFFQEWKTQYTDSIYWLSRDDGGKVKAFNKKENYIKTSNGENFKGDFIHVIPEQKTSDLISKSNLTSSDWCEVNPTTFEIKNQKDVFMVGDSIDAGDMPKSAFSANSQAKILSANFINLILQKEFLEPAFLNTCYSFSAKDRAFSISAWYKLNPSKDRIVSLGSKESEVIASADERFQESVEAYGWYETITKSVFS